MRRVVEHHAYKAKAVLRIILGRVVESYVLQHEPVLGVYLEGVLPQVDFDEVRTL